MADKLSIEETNRMRLAMGMAPLPTGNDSSNGNLNFKPAAAETSDDEEEASTLETRAAAASGNWQKLQDEANEKKRREEKRAQLKKQRDAAQRFAKLEGKGLGDADADDADTRSWLLGTQKRQKKIAKERARMLERELAEREKIAEYTEKDLAGARVGHELGAFDEGAEQILTLKDAAVDAESDEDELENINIREGEKLKERLELKKKRTTYNPNDDDENGQRTILGQYDEEIDGKKKKRFTLNAAGAPEALLGANGEQETIPGRTKVSLDFLQDDTKPVSDYQDISEIKIKKPKKKKDKHKRQKAFDDDELLPTQPTDDSPLAADVMETDTNGAGDVPVKRKLEETSFIDDEDLQSNLALQRRLALKKRKKMRPEDIARQLREEESATPAPMDTREDGEDDGIVIDETREFVNNLEMPQAPEKRRGSSPKPSIQVKQEEDAESEDDVDMDALAHDDPELATRMKRETSSAAPEKLTATGLEDEATLDTGLGSTLKMLTERGLLKTAASGDLNAQHRERQRFLAEKQKREEEAERKARLQRERDRASGKFERMSAREREQYAQWENKQRDQADSRHAAEMFNRDYKPNVELKYVDEFGRHMNQREAFKSLSHQFHGKTSGKQKTEKMLKKVEDEKKREAMSSLDSSQATGMNNAMGATAKKNRQAGVRLQ